MDADVVIIGAGLAGLRCARRLTELGHEVIVLESNDAVGGRIRTDVVDGFRCDRGFQVLNPAYPAVRRWVDVSTLDLKPFGSGVLVRRTQRPAGRRRPDPRTPADGPDDAQRLPPPPRAGRRHAVDRPRHRRPQDRSGTTDSTLADSLDEAGVTGRLRREVLDPFLAGVLVDSHGGSSANFTKLLVRMFALGRPAVPATGMQALPEQVAGPLGDRVRLQQPRRDHHPRPRRRRHPRRRPAPLRPQRRRRHRPGGAAHLTTLPEPVTKGLVTWWFEAPEPPHTLPFVAVDGRRHDSVPPGPVWNTAVLTAAAPSYAPPTKHLVEATCLLDRPDGDAPEADVLRHVGEIYGCDTSGWRVVIRHRVDAALPAMTPPLAVRAPVALGDGVFVCGDHRDTASIQGALVSGQRTAEAVDAHL